MSAKLHGLLEAIWYGNNPLKWLLAPLSWVYRAVAATRRGLYRHGMLPSFDVGAPVIVVGNLSVGGTGKTPVVIWLAQRLLERGFRPGILCSGYGGNSERWPHRVDAASDASEVGDEAVLLARRTGCPVVAGRDRVAAARLLLEQGRIDVVLTDDGLQHYRLRRDLEIAVVDGVRGLGNGWCLPAGPLREPPSRLREVDAVIVNGGRWGHAGVFRAEMAVTGVTRVRDGGAGRLADFKGRLVHAVAAIGHPQRFFDLLEDHGLLVEPHPLPDHAAPTASELAFAEPGAVLITEKDAVKCRAVAHDDVWCVAAELRFAASDGERLLRVLARGLDGEHAA
jgi:tetraacyldisaccharide 4'-kinase